LWPEHVSAAWILYVSPGRADSPGNWQMKPGPVRAAIAAIELNSAALPTRVWPAGKQSIAEEVASARIFALVDGQGKDNKLGLERADNDAGRVKGAGQPRWTCQIVPGGACVVAALQRELSRSAWCQIFIEHLRVTWGDHGNCLNAGQVGKAGPLTGWP